MGNVHFDLPSRDSTELQNLYSHLILPQKNPSLFTRPTMRFHQSPENCSIAELIRLGCCMFYSSKILILDMSLQTKVSLQTKQLAIVIKVVRN